MPAGTKRESTEAMQMRIAVFGASGRTGRPLVAQALEEGHAVTALVRDPARLDLAHGRLRLVRGDVADPERVAEVVRGQDAVLVALGPGPQSPPEALTEGIRRIIAAMRENGVQRVVAVSGAGIDVPGDRKRLPDRLISRLVRVLNRRDVLAKEEQHRLFQESGLEWTLVRPPRLADGPRTGTCRADAHRLEGRPVLNRADLAEFMLREAREGRYLRQAPFVGGWGVPNLIQTERASSSSRGRSLASPAARPAAGGFRNLRWMSGQGKDRIFPTP